MSGRVLAVNVCEQNALGGTTTYLAGVKESQIPDEIVEGLGDHVWASGDAVAPVGIEAQKAETGTNVVVHPDGTESVVGPEGSPSAQPETGAETAEQLAELTVAELEERCQARGLPHSGNKAELIARLIDGE
jgi:hypothetical protein